MQNYYQETELSPATYYYQAAGVVYEIERSTNPGRPDDWIYRPVGRREWRSAPTRREAERAVKREAASRKD